MAIAAVIAVAMLCAMAWFANRPASVEVVPAQALGVADTAVARKTEAVKKKKAAKPTRRQPRKRNFLDEPVPSE